MKTLICSEPGKLRYGMARPPEAKPGYAIIRIRRIGICGTDLHAYEGTQPFFNYPRILGHELSGELIDTGDADGFKVGETVTFLPYYHCGYCFACRSGKPNCCVNMQVCGVHIDGGMTEYLSVPSTALVHGKGLNPDELALVEPLAIGAHAISRANITPGAFVLVVGAGPIGLFTMAFARIAGAKVIALDLNESRLGFCKDKINVDYTINAGSAYVADDLSALTNGDMPSIVIDATGNQSAINNSFRYMSHGAKYILVGLQKGEVRFNHPEFHRREGTLMSSRNALRSDFNKVIDFIHSGLIKPEDFITNRMPFEQAKNAFESMLNQGNDQIKSMISLD